MKKIFKKAAAISMLGTALAFTGLTTGCDLATSPTTEDIDNGGETPTEKVITLGTTVGEVKEGVLAPTYIDKTPVSTSEAIGINGFYRYMYNPSDFKEGITYKFNNKSSKKISVNLEGRSLNNVTIEVTNACLEVENLTGNSTVTIDNPFTISKVGNATVVKMDSPFDKAPSFTSGKYPESTVTINACGVAYLEINNITKTYDQWGF